MFVLKPWYAKDFLTFLNKFLKAGKTKSGFGNKKGDNNAKGNRKTPTCPKSSHISFRA